MQLKNSDLEAKAQGEDTNSKRNTTKHRFSLSFSGRDKSEALREFYAEAQLENVSS